MNRKHILYKDEQEVSFEHGIIYSELPGLFNKKPHSVIIVFNKGEKGYAKKRRNAWRWFRRHDNK